MHCVVAGFDTYLGPPDFITTDAGRNFAKDFKALAGGIGIHTKSVPVEAHNSIGMVERYHQPLRRAYSIFEVEFPHLSKEMKLQMAVKAVNDTAGPDGLVPTLLVLQRADTIKKAMEEVRKLRARMQVDHALSIRNGPDVSPRT